MRNVIIALVLLAGFGLAVADDGYTYDWQTGNSYTWNTDSSGNTNVYGNNFQNGSSWNATIDSRGNQQGMDSQGNYWQYNQGTGTYYNYGTGEIRYNWQ